MNDFTWVCSSYLLCSSRRPQYYADGFHVPWTFIISTNEINWKPRFRSSEIRKFPEWSLLATSRMIPILLSFYIERGEANFTVFSTRHQHFGTFFLCYHCEHICVNFACRQTYLTDFSSLPMKKKETKWIPKDFGYSQDTGCWTYRHQHIQGGITEMFWWHVM